MGVPSSSLRPVHEARMNKIRQEHGDEVLLGLGLPCCRNAGEEGGGGSSPQAGGSSSSSSSSRRRRPAECPISHRTYPEFRDWGFRVLWLIATYRLAITSC